MEVKKKIRNGRGKETNEREECKNNRKGEMRGDKGKDEMREE